MNIHFIVDCRNFLHNWDERLILDKKYVFIAGVAVVISVVTALYLLGFMSSGNANVEISGSKHEVLIYAGLTHQIFEGTVVNTGNLEAQNVVVTVMWVDLHNIEHQDTAEIGGLGLGESSTYSVDFPTDSMVVVTYFTQWVNYE